MTQEQYMSIKIGSLLYNESKGIVVESVSGWAAGTTLGDLKDNSGIWTRNSYSIGGFNESGCGDIKLAEHEEWEILHSFSQIKDDKIIIAILMDEIRAMKNFLSWNFSQYNNRAFKGIL